MFGFKKIDSRFVNVKFLSRLFKIPTAKTAYNTTVFNRTKYQIERQEQFIGMVLANIKYQVGMRQRCVQIDLSFDPLNEYCEYLDAFCDHDEVYKVILDIFCNKAGYKVTYDKENNYIYLEW